MYIPFNLQLTFLPVNKRVFGTIPMVDYLKDTIRNFIAPPCLSQKYVYKSIYKKHFLIDIYMTKNSDYSYKSTDKKIRNTFFVLLVRIYICLFLFN